MSAPVVVTAHFSPKPGTLDALRAALVASIPAVHEEDGCELYAIHDVPDGSIMMIEKWSSRELLAAHGSGAAVAALNEAVSDVVAAPPVVVIMDPIPAGTEAQGQL
ncbi:MAG: antibiotic biosynthesis monooxygenase [Microbacterium arborescens]